MNPSLLGILDKKLSNELTEYLVKWENYEEPTWEPKSNIPEFITSYYEKTGQSKIPAARVRHTKIVGKSVSKRLNFLLVTVTLI